MARQIGDSRPRYDSEVAVFEHLLEKLPDEFYVSANFYLHYNDRPHEIDLAVFGPGVICLIDAKQIGWARVGGRDWTTRHGTIPNPHNKIDEHAKVFRSQMNETVGPRLKGDVPRVRGLVVLSNPDVDLEFVEDRFRVSEILRLDQCIAYIERVRGTRGAASTGPVLKAFLKVIGGGQAPIRNQLGDFVLGSAVDEDRQIFLAKQATGRREPRLVRKQLFDGTESPASLDAYIRNARDVRRKLIGAPHPALIFPEEPVEIRPAECYLQVTELPPDAVPLKRLFSGKNRKQLTEEARREIAKSVIEGIRHLHGHGVVHRDLGHHSIFVQLRVSGARAVLTGFDFAWSERGNRETVIGRVPEIADLVAMHRAGRSVHSSAVDIFQLGRLLRDLLAGMLTEAQEELVTSMMSADDSNRPGIDTIWRDFVEQAGEPAVEDVVPVENEPKPEEAEPDWNNLPEGFVVGNRFVIDRRLSNAGSTGVVYRARDELLRLGGNEEAPTRHRAVKFFTSPDPAMREDLIRREFWALDRARTLPSIVTVVQTMESKNGWPPYLVLEYEEDSVNLNDWVKICEGAGGSDAVLRFGLEIARDVARLHEEDIHHCDIKPDNIIVRGAEPETARACLIDFNVCAAIPGQSPAGFTPGYLPPDAERASLADRDVFALARTMLEVLDGADIPAEVEGVLAKATGTSRERRYTCMREFADALHAAASTPEAATPIVDPDDWKIVFPRGWRGNDEDWAAVGPFWEERLKSGRKPFDMLRDVEDPIGGGWGNVYFCVNRMTGRTQVVKIVKSHDNNDPAKPRRHSRRIWMEEVKRNRQAGGGGLENIVVPMRDRAEDDYPGWMLFDAGRGITLAARIVRARRRGRPTPIGKVASWVLQLGELVDRCRMNNLPFYDLHPGNVLVGESDELQLLDLGVCQPPPPYSPPEWSARQPELAASDVREANTYSLAVIFLELLLPRAGQSVLLRWRGAESARWSEDTNEFMHDTGAPTIDEVKSDLKRALIERLQADGILDASARATELVQILEVALSEDLRIRRRLDGPHDAGRRLRDVLRQ